MIRCGLDIYHAQSLCLGKNTALIYQQLNILLYD